MSRKQRERVEQLTEQMNKAIENYKTNPQDELDLLNSIKKFKQYSVRNNMLIQSQYQGALAVASYKDFQKLGYQVQRGEKASYILAPRFQDVFKDEENIEKFVSRATKKEKELIKKGELEVQKNKLVGYISVPVFDVTQTNCPAEDYPKLYPNKPENFDFNYTDEELKDFERALESYAEKKGISVSNGKMEGAERGYYVPRQHKIVLRDTLGETERPKVLLHELAHAEMHNAEKSNKMPTPVKEYQAEMTAFVVSDQFGLDSEEYSKRYLANWTERDVTNDVYINSLEEVKETATNMTKEIVTEYNEIINQKELTQDELNAKKLRYLEDKNGVNRYPLLKDDKLKMTGIKESSIKKSFTDYDISLEDRKGNQYLYNIRTIKNRNEIIKDWKERLTGREWLNEDVKNEVLNRKPNMTIENSLPNNSEDFETLEEFSEESKRELTPKM